MTERRWRLFVAASLPPAPAHALWLQLADLRRRHPAARWTPLEQYHITLVFLGAMPPADVERLVHVVGSTARTWPAVPATLGRAGGRVADRRDGVAWLTLAEGREQLSRLALELDRALGSDAYGASPPRPHVTVARGIDEGLLSDLRRAGAAVQLSWTVGQLALLRSHTERQGARYEELAAFALRG